MTGLEWLERYGARRGLSVGQWAALALVLALLVWSASRDLQAWLVAARLTLGLVFTAAALWRVAVILLAKPQPPAPALPDISLPAYTVIVPLHREAEMVGQIVGAMDALEYPRDRLQVIIALEQTDGATVQAAHALALPPGFEIMVAPAGRPQTKPRACNLALERATGALVTIYDAEDRPDPQQLREAAARFAAGPANLGCLQAPLRIANSRGFFGAQFANEYAAQFELLLPALARLNLPFPLGGTSNHLRTDVLRRLGGWDAWNVTEDADLGFRLAQAGWRSGVLTAPTYEMAPEHWDVWLPQRTRWLKGYMQTVMVQTRRGAASPRLAFAMTLTLGLTLLAAAAHLPAAAWLATYGSFWLAGGPGPSLTLVDLSALVGGWSAALVSIAIAARRAERPLRARDLLLAPLYWPLLTIAFVHAAWRFFVEPHYWDKTDHEPWRMPAV